MGQLCILLLYLKIMQLTNLNDLKNISSTDTFKVDTSDWENRNLSVKWWISK